MPERSNIVVEIEQRSELRATLRNGRAAILRVLKHRFKTDVPTSIISNLEGIENPTQLEDLLDTAADTPSVAQFQLSLEK